MPVDFTVLSRFLRLRIVFPELSPGDLIKDFSEFAYADYEMIETVSEHLQDAFYSEGLNKSDETTDDFDENLSDLKYSMLCQVFRFLFILIYVVDYYLI